MMSYLPSIATYIPNINLRNKLFAITINTKNYIRTGTLNFFGVRCTLMKRPRLVDDVIGLFKKVTRGL